LYEDYRDLKIEKRDNILVITMDNPPLNAAMRQSHTELSRIFEEINHDSSTNVVVLTGAGQRAFSAGGDIDGMIGRIQAGDHAAWNASMIEARHIVYGLLRLEKPLIGRINGHAIGLGATLAAFCDVSFMMADAKIADTHVNVGLTAGDGGALMWPLLVGFQKAKYHLLTGEPLTGRQAMDCGLITQSTESLEELDQLTYGMAERLARSATLAVNTTKIAVNLLFRKIIEGLVETHLGFETQTALTGDHLEAALAFKERRLPKFTGR
jgi:enoyl-CoA hydratase